MLAALKPVVQTTLAIYKKIVDGHWGLLIRKKRLDNAAIYDSMINHPVYPPACQNSNIIILYDVRRYDYYNC